MSSVNIGDYTYTVLSESEQTASAEVISTSKSSYGSILSSVTIDGIEYSITDVRYCFFACKALTTPPEIPSGVTNMTGCFHNCTSLTTAPEIPSSVRWLSGCFNGCTLLTGNIIVHNNPDLYNDVFSGTTQPIKICPANVNVISTWQKIANEYSNVSMGLDLITYTFLSSRRLTPTENTTYGTTRGVRIDMLLDCGDSYALTGMTPSSDKLYTIDGTQITFPYYSPNLLRCYLIYEPSSQVPTGKLIIQVQNINTTFSSLQVYLPSTATISQFEQEENGATKQLASQINNLESLKFNPQGNTVTNVGSLVPYIYQSITGDTLNTIDNDNKTQINTLKSDNTLDIKHFVTTADNIQVTTDKTLQDIITECYEALET